MVPANKKAETKGNRKRNAKHRPGVLGAAAQRWRKEEKEVGGSSQSGNTGMLRPQSSL